MGENNSEVEIGPWDERDNRNILGMFARKPTESSLRETTALTIPSVSARPLTTASSKAIKIISRASKPSTARLGSYFEINKESGTRSIIESLPRQPSFQSRSRLSRGSKQNTPRMETSLGPYIEKIQRQALVMRQNLGIDRPKSKSNSFLRPSGFEYGFFDEVATKCHNEGFSNNFKISLPQKKQGASPYHDIIQSTLLTHKDSSYAIPPIRGKKSQGTKGKRQVTMSLYSLSRSPGNRFLLRSKDVTLDLWERSSVLAKR
eukprot:TRINITY_DN14196_c0_g1_i1.p1 TRINITY_DN14196_c0_g1~~TRINITY_DN14196_c0_g1_i1.p1  ORF type:complete len:261 (-),score=22.83 TRINITY_DN14196_c0_g1_i1:122-904(-)